MKLEKPEERKIHTSAHSYSMGVELITNAAQMANEYPKSVKCNPYNVGQMKKLVYAADNHLYLSLVVSVLQEITDFDIESLSMIDLDLLLLHLRINSMPGDLGARSTYSATCPKCKIRSPFQVDLTTMDVRNFPAGFNEVRKLSDTISLCLPRVKTILQAYEITGEKTPLDDQISFIYEGDTYEDKLEIHNASSPDVAAAIDSYIKEVSQYGLDNFVKFKCSAMIEGEPCSGEARVRIPFRHSFFLPDLS